MPRLTRAVPVTDDGVLAGWLLDGSVLDGSVLDGSVLDTVRLLVSWGFTSMLVRAGCRPDSQSRPIGLI
jgi:hypothetical protein